MFSTKLQYAFGNYLSDAWIGKYHLFRNSTLVLCKQTHAMNYLKEGLNGVNR